MTLPASSYLHGRPPSATWVPPPVAVKNAGIPEPPARIRSASVPCGRQLDLQLTGEVLPGELLVLPDVRRDHPPQPLLHQQPAQTPLVDTAVVRHRLEVGRPRPRAPRRSAPTGRRTARTHRPPASRRPGCRPPPPQRSPRPCPCTHLLRGDPATARSRPLRRGRQPPVGSVDRPHRRVDAARGRRHRTSRRPAQPAVGRGDAPSTRCRRASRAGCPASSPRRRPAGRRACCRRRARPAGRRPLERVRRRARGAASATVADAQQPAERAAGAPRRRRAVRRRDPPPRVPAELTGARPRSARSAPATGGPGASRRPAGRRRVESTSVQAAAAGSGRRRSGPATTSGPFS